MMVGLVIVAALGWIGAGFFWFVAKRDMGGIGKRLADEVIKETLEPKLEKARTDIGIMITDHDMKLAEAYADHADEMARLLRSAGYDPNDWVGRAAGAREIASAIRKSQKNLFRKDVNQEKAGKKEESTR